MNSANVRKKSSSSSLLKKPHRTRSTVQQKTYKPIKVGLAPLVFRKHPSKGENNGKLGSEQGSVSNRPKADGETEGQELARHGEKVEERGKYLFLNYGGKPQRKISARYRFLMQLLI